MNKLEPHPDLVDLPRNAGIAIVESAAMLACPLLRTDDFSRFCKKRELDVDRVRLLRLERMGLFAPVFRVRTPDEKDATTFCIPGDGEKSWFDRGWAWDTTAIPVNHTIPTDDDRSQEGYYSIFQVDYLRQLLSQVNFEVKLDLLLSSGAALAPNWGTPIAGVLEATRSSLENARHHSFRRALALLCQYVSNRYYPKALGDLRSVRMRNVSSSDK